MQLIMSPASPYVRKVRVVLRETGLIDRVEEVEVATSPMESDPRALAANPLGKIPALIREDGPSIYDSRVITRYLDHLSGTTLYPEKGLFEVLTLEATADAIMDAAVGMVYGERFRSDPDDWVDGQWAKAERALGAIDTLWISHLRGPLTIAQIAVACALGYIDLRHHARNWRDGHAALATWFEEFGARESMQATNP